MKALINKFVSLVLLATLSFGNLARTFTEPGVIQTLAQYSRPSSPLLDALLKKQGFDLPQGLGWERWSSVKKIEYAWACAEQGATAQGKLHGGKAFLHQLTLDLGDHYEAVRYERQVSDLLQPENRPGPVTFARPPPGVAASLPEAYRGPVKTLVKYLERGARGNIFQVLQFDLGLSAAQVDQVVFSSSTFEEAFARGVNKLPETAREAKLRSLAVELARTQPALRQEADLAYVFTEVEIAQVRSPRMPETWRSILRSEFTSEELAEADQNPIGFARKAGMICGRCGKPLWFPRCL